MMGCKLAFRQQKGVGKGKVFKSQLGVLPMTFCMIRPQ